MSKAPRPSTWSRDELLLALDLYFRRKPHAPDYHDPDVIIARRRKR
jgi:hypothetical protein